jgi:hypothetical protein
VIVPCIRRPRKPDSSTFAETCQCRPVNVQLYGPGEGKTETHAKFGIFPRFVLGQDAAPSLVRIAP